MFNIERHPQNPILRADLTNFWEAEAVFNGCPAKDGASFHFVYRAVSAMLQHSGAELQLSSIGYAQSSDGVNFKNRRRFIEPEYDWELFGCEDPRITKLGGKYYIFYTALSTYPPCADGIKIGLAITKDFERIEEKRQITFFNSKAMALFPEKINGKYAAILTVHSDSPPAKICIASFDYETEIWSKEYWEHWYALHDDYVVPLQRDNNDHIEVGAPPIKTRYGWLLIYGYIRNFFSSPRIFGIEAALLNSKDPCKILERTSKPILVPEKQYEICGKVPNVIFPSGAFIKNGKLFIYYGAADTACCLATCKVKELFKEMNPQFSFRVPALQRGKAPELKRFEDNPIIRPRPEYPWEAKATFNPGAFFANGKAHIIYRAMAEDNSSVFGYATSKDGLHIEERAEEPIYAPGEDFEKKMAPGNSGCEDPRFTKIDNQIFMTYTAVNAAGSVRVALTSITLEDFLAKHWNWKKPVLISSPEYDDKNACIFPRKISGRYAMLHRIAPDIWIDFVDNLNFDGTSWLRGQVLARPRENSWDNKKIGMAMAPFETPKGWLLLYHGVFEVDNSYRVGAMLLDIENPEKVISRLPEPILEPKMSYEREGQTSNVVFPCGAVVIGKKLFVYYGGGDSVIGVATINFNALLKKLLQCRF